MEIDVKCEGCGADLAFKPGTTGLTCNYCSKYTAFHEPDAANDAKTELNLEEYLHSFVDESQQIKRRIISCTECGADTELEPNQQSVTCPFCATALIIAQAHTETFIKPKGLLPFQIDKKAASANVKKWLDSLWFAPGVLKLQAQFQKMNGIYLPYWTYDCSTASRYTGQRGTYYYKTVNEKDAQGNAVTREVRHTQWSFVSSSIDSSFDDILIPATKSLPENNLNALEPWDLTRLVDYKDEYLTGFITETYQIDLKTGYTRAKEIIDARIREYITRDIGGDDQRIMSVDTRYFDAKFKHLLLPVWVCAYHYQSKLYQIVVNARTGAIYGERPWSWVKITLFIAAIVLVVGAGIMLTG